MTSSSWPSLGVLLLSLDAFQSRKFFTLRVSVGFSKLFEIDVSLSFPKTVRVSLGTSLTAGGRGKEGATSLKVEIRPSLATTINPSLLSFSTLRSHPCLPFSSSKPFQLFVLDLFTRGSKPGASFLDGLSVPLPSPLEMHLSTTSLTILLHFSSHALLPTLLAPSNNTTLVFLISRLRRPSFQLSITTPRPRSPSLPSSVL